MCFVLFFGHCFIAGLLLAKHKLKKQTSPDPRAVWKSVDCLFCFCLVPVLCSSVHLNLRHMRELKLQLNLLNFFVIKRNTCKELELSPLSSQLHLPFLFIVERKFLVHS